MGRGGHVRVDHASGLQLDCSLRALPGAHAHTRARARALGGAGCGLELDDDSARAL